MKVLVTGPGGFVGRALCDYLANGGYTVVSAGRQGDQRIGPIGPDTDWRAALHGVEVVVHLAGLAHVPNKSSAALDDDFYRINALGLRALALQARQAAVSKFVFLSSATVMGITSGDVVWNEAHSPSPANAYARSKIEAEGMLKDIAEQGGMAWVALRPPLVYGPGVKANFRALIKIASLGLPIPLGGVRNRRDMIALTNLCSAIEASFKVTQTISGPYFVRDEEAVSTTTLLKDIAMAMGRRSLQFAVPDPLLHIGAALLGRQADMIRLSGNFQINDTLFRETFGWRPPISRAEELARTVSEYRS